MKYDPSWIPASLEDQRAFCMANQVPQAAKAIASAIRVCKLEIKQLKGASVEVDREQLRFESEGV